MNEVEEGMDVVHRATYPAVDAVRPAHLVVDRAHRPGVVEVDVVQTLEIGPIRLRLSGQWMIGWTQEEDWSPTDLHPIQGPEVIRARDKGCVQFAGADHVEQDVGAGLREVDSHLGIAAMEAFEQRRYVHHSEALFGADPKLPGQLPGDPDDGVTSGTGLAEQLACVGKQRQPSIGRLNSARGTGEEDTP